MSDPTDSHDSASESESPLEVAVESDRRVNQMLAGPDGGIATMQYTGAVGYHINVATGETHSEYLWKVALLQALDETVFEMVHIEDQHPADARRQLDRVLEQKFTPYAADRVGNLFEEKLTTLIESKEAEES